MNLQLRPVIDSDIRHFFEQQRDPVARHQVAYVVPNPDDWDTFQEKWEKIVGDQTALMRTILVDDVVVGNVGCHSWYGRPEVGYWIDREHWGRELPHTRCWNCCGSSQRVRCMRSPSTIISLRCACWRSAASSRAGRRVSIPIRANNPQKGSS